MPPLQINSQPFVPRLPSPHLAPASMGHNLPWSHSWLAAQSWQLFQRYQTVLSKYDLFLAQVALTRLRLAMMVTQLSRIN